MEPPSVLRFPAGDAKPLHPLSPERVNAARTSSTATTASTGKRSEAESVYEVQSKSPQSSPSRRVKGSLFADLDLGTTPTNKISGFSLPQSPSLPEIHAIRSHVRNNSDVQGLVKRFEHLDVRDRDAETLERVKKNEAELRRAQIAREEAESDVKRLREETRRLRKERDDGMERERRVSKRLEAVMDEYTTHKEATSSQASVYEKELRKARKEAFKSSSAVLKFQEELKSSRASLRVCQSTLELEKQKLLRKEQERFEMEYQLIPLQEQVEKLSQRLQIAEAERETLKKSLKEEELARIASEGMIALPASQEQDDDLASPRRSPRKQVMSPLSDDKENMEALTKKNVEMKRLMQNLAAEKVQREHFEELAEFLQMECRFRCCNCTTASELGSTRAINMRREMAERIEQIRIDMSEILTSGLGDLDPVGDQMEVEIDLKSGNSDAADSTALVSHTSDEVTAIHLERLDSPKSFGLNEALSEEDSSVQACAEETRAPDSPSAQLMREESDDGAPTKPSLHPLDVDASQQPHAPMAETVNGKTEERSDTLMEEPAESTPVKPETPPHTFRGTPFRQQHSIRTVTTTTTIPMQFTPVAKPPVRDLGFGSDEENTENIPPHSAPAKSDGNGADLLPTPTFDRAAALAAIEYRRGRARSFAAGLATPKKQMIEGVRERRDISAPALGQKVNGSDTTKQDTVPARSGSVGRKTRR